MAGSETNLQDVTSIDQRLAGLMFPIGFLYIWLIRPVARTVYLALYLPVGIIRIYESILENLPWAVGTLVTNPTGLFSPVFLKRVRKFKTLRRGYLSFLILSIGYGTSFLSELLVNDRALVVHYEGETYFPAFADKKYRNKDFGITKGSFRLTDFRELKTQIDEENAEKREANGGKPAPGENYVILPPYPYGPNENLLGLLEGNPPHSPSRHHWLGTDDRGRDVFARLVYGFRISVSFGLLVTLFSYFIGIIMGGCLGYYGGRVDMLGLRLVEIWSAIPFLYAVMILAAILIPSFGLLALILSIFGWMGITYYVRGEFLREKSRDYVAAATSIGLSDGTIIFKHILPNSLTPVISFAPFAILTNIISLVSLDFLGFGLPPPTPSWGELLGQGLSNLDKPWLVFSPMTALFITLLLISFIGEATREAFDPKVYSRLR